MSMIDLSDKERRLAERVNPDVTGALIVSESAGGVLFSNASQVMEFSKMMALSQIGVRKHLRGNPGACLSICIQAIEWGMSPFAVANKSYLVNDQIAFESQLVQAVILKRAPIKGRFKVEYTGEGGRRKCRVWAQLRDEPDEIVEYESPEFNSITPKNSPLWKSDPDQQQFYYSGRALCRRHFPDVLLGVYAEDELSHFHAAPEQPKDVTPSRTLSGKLDVLATASVPAHDEQTGEILEDETSSGSTAATIDDDAPIADEAGQADDEPDYDSLLADLRQAFANAETEAELLAVSEKAAKAWFNDAPRAVRDQGTDIFEARRKELKAPPKRTEKLKQQDAAKPASKAEGITDPDLKSLYFEGMEQARKGSTKLKFWIGKLSAPDFDRIETYLDDMRDVAKQSD